MTVRVGINGFGRIGRNFLRAARAKGADLEIVAVNDVTDAKTNALLLRHDSTHGLFPGDVQAEEGHLLVDGLKIAVLSERNPAELPWRELGATVVIESTGKFTDRDDAAAHLEGGAERVLVSAPSNGADLTIVMGVNDQIYDPAIHVVLSNASCTTNCFVPMVKVLEDAFGIDAGLMTTVHAMTNDQNLQDLAHKDPRRARAAPVNIVPASTGAARATGKVVPSMSGRLDGTALRVPVADGSITDFTALVPGTVSVEDINDAFRKASETGSLAPYLQYTDEPLVSSDIIGNPSSCIFDSGLTMVVAASGDRTLVKVNGWYDNEWGYSNRLVDVTMLVGGGKQS
jgi:glyceraldehyde 3-phosphate dehydrogenase